jgi:hypothetical protein
VAVAFEMSVKQMAETMAARYGPGVGAVLAEAAWLLAEVRGLGGRP